MSLSGYGSSRSSEKEGRARGGDVAVSVLSPVRLGTDNCHPKGGGRRSDGC